jgi:hypothetical protein
MHNTREAALEQLVDRTLRELPLLHAPAALQARVLSEIEQRAAMPWWRAGFVRWPRAAQVAFLPLLLVVLAGVVPLVLEKVLAYLSALQAPALPDWIVTTGRTLTSLAGVADALFRLVPSHWLYAALFVGAGLYVTLFGLGAVAYRVVYK